MCEPVQLRVLREDSVGSWLTGLCVFFVQCNVLSAYISKACGSAVAQ